MIFDVKKTNTIHRLDIIEIHTTMRVAEITLPEKVRGVRVVEPGLMSEKEITITIAISRVDMSDVRRELKEPTKTISKVIDEDRETEKA